MEGVRIGTCMVTSPPCFLSVMGSSLKTVQQ